MFSRRSEAAKHQGAILQCVRQADFVVLGGDMFDFRWTTYQTIEQTTHAALAWLDNLMRVNPRCRFDYILGNHDWNRDFTRRLGRFVHSAPNLSWHKYYFRNGANIFLHGDVADRKMNQRMLVRSRSKWKSDDKRGRTANAMYNAVVSSRLHKVAGAVVHRKRRVAKKILVYLEDIGHTPVNGLREVYFGHTHVPMANYYYRGLTFHNGGAPIKGLKFRIVPVKPY